MKKKTNHSMKSDESTSKRSSFAQKMKEYREFLREDEDYDWQYIIRLLRYKLERTKNHIVEHDIIDDATKVGKEIQAVVDLLKRIEEDKYFEELHKPFLKKYGNPKLVLEKCKNGTNSSITFKYSKETLKNRSQRMKEQNRLAKLEHQLRKKDLEQAFKLMSNNIFGWWD